MLILQLLVDGVGKGAIYAALALAIVVSHRSTGLINFAQGEFATLSAMFCALLVSFGVPIWGALGVSVVVSFIVGAIIQRGLVALTFRRSHIVQVMMLIALYICANAIGQIVFGPTPKSLAPLFPDGAFEIAGIRITWSLVGVLLLQTLVIVALSLFFAKTKAGLSFRAVASAADASRLVGIRVERMHMLGWGLAAAIGAVAGVSLTNLGVYVQPTMMSPVLVFSLAAITIGGFDSAPGAIVGGVIMGVVETLATAVIPGLTGDAGMVVSLVVIVGILLVRPQGLFGRKKVVRV